MLPPNLFSSHVHSYCPVYVSSLFDVPSLISAEFSPDLHGCRWDKTLSQRLGREKIKDSRLVVEVAYPAAKIWSQNGERTSWLSWTNLRNQALFVTGAGAKPCVGQWIRGAFIDLDSWDKRLWVSIQKVLTISTSTVTSYNKQADGEQYSPIMLGTNWFIMVAIFIAVFKLTATL